jgi:hypothetical protein
MIVFDLECHEGGHKFEGWFGSSDDFTRQQDRGLVTCPHCGSARVSKALMAPHVARKSNQLPDPSKARRSKVGVPAAEAPTIAATSQALPAQALAFMQKLATIQAEALKTSRFVGSNFAEDARAMHYGEREVETIHGQTTRDQAEELLEEGIAIAPLLFPVIPPDQAN